MAYGQDIEQSMAAGFARAGIGSPREVASTLSSLADVAKAKTQAAAVQGAAGLQAAGQAEAAYQRRQGQVEATNIASLRDLAGRKYTADKIKDWTKTEEGAKYLAEKTPQAMALKQLADENTRKQNLGAFQTGIYNIPGIGGVDKGTGEFKFTDPSFESIFKKHQTTAEKNPNAALQAATEELGRAQLGTEASRSKALANWNLYHGGNAPPGSEELFTKKEITPENQAFYQHWLNYQPKKAAAIPGQTSRDTGAAATALDRLVQLGQSLKHEMSPPGTIGETLLGSRGAAPPSLESVRAQRIAERERAFNEDNPLRRAASVM